MKTKSVTEETLRRLKQRHIELGEQLNALYLEILETQKKFEEENPLPDLKYWDWMNWEFRHGHVMPIESDSPEQCNYAYDGGDECGSRDIVFRFKSEARCESHYIELKKGHKE